MSFVVVGHTIRVIANGMQRPVGTHVVWWAKDTHSVGEYEGQVQGAMVSSEQAARLHADFLNRLHPDQHVVVVPLYALLEGHEGA